MVANMDERRVAADQALAHLGYQSELPRNLSMMSILGLSFAIMAVPYGLSTTIYITLSNGQSVSIIWGWLLVSLISICIAASLAEICAVFPTAGGVYYWSAMLSTPKWAASVSFVDGWLTLVGNWTVTLSINFGGAQLILSAVTLFDPDYVPTQWQTVLCFWAVMLVCALVNVFGSRYLDLINKVCIYWTGASVLIILITILVMAPERHSGDYVFGHYDASASGWPAAWSFFVGLLSRQDFLPLLPFSFGRLPMLALLPCVLPTRNTKALYFESLTQANVPFPPSQPHMSSLAMAW